jgi:Cof subfamily protein (haloacid dehalogenase superfamily)
MPDIFFFDIDGTLIDSPNQIFAPTRLTIDAINQLKAQGHFVLIATGRIYEMIDQQITNIGFDGYITCNGAHCVFKDQPVLNLVTDQNLLARFLKDCQRLRTDVILESLDCQYVYRFSDAGFYEDYQSHYQLRADIAHHVEDLTDAPIYKLNLCGVHQLADIEELRCLYENEFDIMQQGTSHYYDVNQKGITKGTAVQAVLDFLSDSYQISYAFGDGDNDKEMFQVVDIGIMMGHAHDNLTPFAKMETTTVKDEGITSALIKLGYLKKV